VDFGATFLKVDFGATFLKSGFFAPLFLKVDFA
jgi:hypothetical protein